MRKQIRLLINELIRLISAKFSGKKSIFRLEKYIKILEYIYIKGIYRVLDIHRKGV
jgi:hypothetical protein